MGACGTFACFSDTGESVTDIFTSGTLDLQLDGQNDVGAIVTHDNVAPGDVVDGRLVLTNDGTISSYDGGDHTVLARRGTPATRLPPFPLTGERS